MEELATKLLAEGIQKKVVSPGKGELSTFPDGTKVSYKILHLIHVQRVVLYAYGWLNWLALLASC